MNVLLIGPHDPHKGETSFMAPPLGVWRICGFLRDHGFPCDVFDPNIHHDIVAALQQKLKQDKPGVVGFSLTSLTLPYDLALIHAAKKMYPQAVFVGGGIAATFEYELVLQTSPLDFCVLGEGEIPLLRICQELAHGTLQPQLIPGLAYRVDHACAKNANPCLTYDHFRAATFAIPYEEMPINVYWDKMLSTPHGKALPPQEKLAWERDIKAVRLMTMNYCPMGCTFCSYTHFLNSANDGQRAQMVRLQPEDVAHMVTKIARLFPEMKTLIFQDDMFIVKGDQRIRSLFDALFYAKKEGRINEDVSFIASCRIDCMDISYLESMGKAGFRVIGYGIESFSRNVLKEYGKENIYNKIDTVLQATLQAGIKPFLDIILVSPQSTLLDVQCTLEKCLEYIEQGCECAINSAVMPLAGSAMASNPRLQSFIQYEEVPVSGTTIRLQRGKRIQPERPELREFLSKAETAQKRNMSVFSQKYGSTHFPSRIRSLFYILGVLETYPALLSYSPERVWDKIYSMAGLYDAVKSTC